MVGGGTAMQGSRGRRGVYMRQSNSWDGVWTAPRQFVLDPANVVPRRQHKLVRHLYRPTCNHTMVSMSACRRCIITREVQVRVVPSYPTVMVSRDGRNWSFPAPSRPHHRP